jgi:hypothetical protein
MRAPEITPFGEMPLDKKIMFPICPHKTIIPSQIDKKTGRYDSDSYPLKTAISAFPRFVARPATSALSGLSLVA